MGDDKILKGVVRGLGQLGMETLENASEEGQKIIESVITGKELLGLESTMTDAQLKQYKQQDKIKSQDEINKLKGQMGDKKENSEQEIKEKPRSIEEELAQLRRQKEQEEGEKQKYYEQQKQQEQEKERQQAEYIDLTAESSNPSKQKKSRGSAFVNKKKHKPDTAQMSQTQEFNKGGKID